MQKSGALGQAAFNFGAVNFASDCNSNYNEEGDVIATDLDFFESELKMLQEQLQNNLIERQENTESEKIAVVINASEQTVSDFKKSLGIAQMLLKTSRNWLAENQEL